MYTVIPYLYRDAANHKQSEVIVLAGELSSDDVELVQSRLNDGEYFIPGDLKGFNLEELQPRMVSFPSDDDHVWHELCLDDIEVKDELSEGEVALNAVEFVAAFAAISGPEGWDVAAAAVRLEV